MDFKGFGPPIRWTTIRLLAIFLSEVSTLSRKMMTRSSVPLTLLRLLTTLLFGVSTLVVKTWPSKWFSSGPDWSPLGLHCSS
ncbi:hypothetical protein TNIN_214291 [Trichonephila inaurata madagascariensis]|uniref:Uncharacterized protein n=1 Tax=Trichonephila inaurata madagascariensis TaxID=2747483 RepID=A0A8X7BV38_9ARAC|nr:hypothetical protein TNIN_214291 [Trichonephila inaurata madagascariensis]